MTPHTNVQKETQRGCGSFLLSKLRVNCEGLRSTVTLSFARRFTSRRELQLHSAVLGAPEASILLAVRKCWGEQFGIQAEVKSLFLGVVD